MAAAHLQLVIIMICQVLHTANYSVFTSARGLYFRQRYLICSLSFVSKISQNYSTDFWKIPWKGDTWAMEKPITFW